jgi:hypothetical protein
MQFEWEVELYFSKMGYFSKMNELIELVDKILRIKRSLSEEVVTNSTVLILLQLVLMKNH